MHGRVKVRTSEEEKARKHKERQEKLKLFQCAMTKIQNKRKLRQLDKELLDVTGQVLVANPDIYTLWNIRRETIQSLLISELSLKDLKTIFDDELVLTEYCLKINPKSYGAWHQREWVLLTRTDPDWKKELELCEKYLKLDERNFHTWDYRRFVVSEYKPSLEHEFQFTTEKLLDNFSNYSAWHYRSKILVELYPDLQAGRPIEDYHHKKELEMVESAAFTDPDDTSAWFYQRWLLGAVKETVRLVVCAVSAQKITVAFNKFISKESVIAGVNIIINNVPITGTFSSATGKLFDNLWIFQSDCAITYNLDVKVTFSMDSTDNQELCCKELSPGVYIGKAKVNFMNQYADAVILELKKQLNSCIQLFELEPDNRWTLLTKTIIQHCIAPDLYHKETIENLNNLKQLDALRTGYYEDLKSKWCIENQIMGEESNLTQCMNIRFSEKLTTLPHLQYYSHCSSVDLSNQNLTSRIVPSLVLLQNCKILILESNQLSSLKGFPSMELRTLNIKGNPIPKNEIEAFKSNHVNVEVII